MMNYESRSESERIREVCLQRDIAEARLKRRETDRDFYRNALCVVGVIAIVLPTIGVVVVSKFICHS